MQRRTWRALLVVGLLLGAGTMLAVNNFQSDQASNISNGVTVSPEFSDFELTIEGDTEMNLSDAFPEPHTVDVNITEGNISLAAQNGTAATIHATNITGTYTNVSEITAGGTWIEIYPYDKQRVDVRGDLNKIAIRDTTIDDGTVDFYISGTDNGVGTVKYYSLPATTRVVAKDANTGALLDKTTTDANGNGTFDIPLSDHSVELVTVADSAPVHSNPDPQGKTPDVPDTISIDVNDSDFPTDEVQTNISLDGTRIHTENITSNATVSTQNFSGDDLDLGQHTFTVNSTDAYGNFQSDTFTFEIPSNITLRNETNASQIITDKNITATFYSENGEVVVQRTDSDEDGNISLAGLPNTAFVVTFSGEGWYDRRVYIDSIFEQDSIYLLNKTAYPDAIATTFVYEDRTDQFDQDETTLEIQRAVDPDNDDEFQFETVAGDFWGAAGEFPFTGQFQQRYRLVVTNRETGDNGQHSSGERVFAEVITGGNSYGIPIDADILASIAYVLLTFVMSLYGPRTALAGAWAGVGFLGFVMVMQWVTVPVATITVAMLIAAGGTVYREAVPG